MATNAIFHFFFFNSLTASGIDFVTVKFLVVSFLLREALKNNTHLTHLRMVAIAGVWRIPPLSTH